MKWLKGLLTHSLLILTVLSVLVVAQSAHPAAARSNIRIDGRVSELQVHVDLPVDIEGTLNRASYRIRVPANWNGTLLVYAHGYTEELPPPYAEAARRCTEMLPM